MQLRHARAGWYQCLIDDRMLQKTANLQKSLGQLYAGDKKKPTVDEIIRRQQMKGKSLNH